MINQEGIQEKNLILILICSALALLTIITYWPLKDCGFIHLDDNAYVYENGYVQQGLNWKSVQWAFSVESTNRSGHWVPITWLSLMLDHELFGFNPHGYHFTNLFFHILNVILLFLIFHHMTKALWPSAFVAALFAIHPLHVESVAWVTERKDVLSTFLWMLTMESYVLYTERKTVVRYFLTIIFFIVGLMAKSMLLTLPFVLILLDYWPLNRFQTALSTSDSQVARRSIRPLLVEKLPIFALAGVFSVIPYLAYLAAQKATDAVSLSFPFALRIENALRSYVIYIGKMILPWDLAIFYPYPMAMPLWQTLGAILILAAISAFVLVLRDRSPYLLFGWLWYLGTLLPAIGLIQAGGQAYADRYTYIPLIGLFIMVAWGVPELLRQWGCREKAFFTLFVLSILLLCIVTRTQVGYWQNSIKLFEHAIKVTDHNYVAYNSLGFAYNDLGDYGQAVVYFDKAIEINPRFIYAYINRGAAYNGLGNHRQALVDFDRAIEINPGDADAHYNLGVAYNGLGNHRQAIVDFDRAIEINPGDADAYNNRGIAYDSLGNHRQAIGDFDRAIEINPGDADAYNNRGIAYGNLGNYRQAIVDFDRAIEINPGDVRAHYNRSLVYNRLGNYRQAIEDLKTAAKFGNEGAKNLLLRQGISW